jgi:predicted phage baseplate assembly protein
MKDFDFLPELPKPNLDDRQYDDLVRECFLRIPRYCPEWTNHNPGDPGVALIELFAWLTDQMLWRFNQVPRRNYITFLELLGIRLRPPTPAKTELTFYVTKAQPWAIIIPNHTEVATLRTETQEAVIFTSDRELVIGTPQIKHILFSNTSDGYLFRNNLGNPFANSTHERNRQWESIEETALFEPQPRPDNCFYLVLTEPTDHLAGNVVAVTFKGRDATPTGIDPENPPLRWEAWDGETWQPILLNREDDHTKGFSFNEIAEEGFNPVSEGADAILHLPQKLPKTDHGTSYDGYWIRCVYAPSDRQQRYSVPPQVVGLAIRAIGGTVDASQCVYVDEAELLGISNGEPGQKFTLQGQPVLGDLRERMNRGEYIRVKLPGGDTDDYWQDWEEVSDFASSTPNQLHYILDAISGEVQFGPLVREPAHLKQQTDQRAQLQAWGKDQRWENGSRQASSLPASVLQQEGLEQQYGAVPQPGAEIYMTSYRTGGGTKGNVGKGELTVLKVAIPYIKSVTNHKPGQYGSDAESLAQAVVRVPEILRTREAAITPEEFESVVKRANPQVARAHCLTDPSRTSGGIVRMLIVPGVSELNHNGNQSLRFQSDFSNGMSPDQYFKLSRELREDVLKYIQNRKPLGIQVRLEEPEYVGVRVLVEVMVERKYDTSVEQDRIRSQLIAALYQFLNPLTGGVEGQGWEWGRPVYTSDIVAICQEIPAVRYVGAVRLFRLLQEGADWVLLEIPEPVIKPAPDALIGSWADVTRLQQADDRDRWKYGHDVRFIDQLLYR